MAGHLYALNSQVKAHCATRMVSDLQLQDQFRAKAETSCKALAVAWG